MKGEDVEQHSVEFTPKRFTQIISALAATIGTFGLGTVVAWSSPAIPNLEKEGQLGVLSNADKSWIGSMVPLGAVLAAFVAGYGMQRIGRKLTMILLGIPFLAGWVLIAGSQNLTMMLIGRFLTGFGGAAFTLVVPVYVSEISEDHIRGLLSTAGGISLALGILFAYILGALVSWTWLSVACGTIPVLFMTCLIFVPESPRYLLEKGRAKSSVLSLQRLRGANMPEQVDLEIKLIEKSIQESNEKPANFKDLFESSVLKPISITIMLMVLQQLGGINAVLFYTVEIFESAGSDIDPKLATIIVGCVGVLLVTVSTLLVDKAGRKVLIIISEGGMAIGLVALGVYFTLKSNNGGKAPDNLGWLPLASLIFYVISYNIGLAQLPWVMMGELLPPHIKGLAGSLATSFCWALAFLVTFTFADLSAWMGPEGCYFLFGAVSLAGMIYAIFIIPETKGKSLDEIQALFKR